MKGKLPADKKTATFEGVLPKGSTHFKLYYRSKQLVLDMFDSKYGGLYSYQQTEDITSPETQMAHMKDFYLLSSGILSLEQLLDNSTPKTLNLMNSLLRMEVKSYPKSIGVLKSISVTPFTKSDRFYQENATITIKNAPAEGKPFVVYMLFNPATMAQEPNQELLISFHGDYGYEVSTITTKATLNTAGHRYNLTVAKTAAELEGAKGLCNWRPAPNDNQVYVESSASLEAKQFVRVTDAEINTDFWAYTKPNDQGVFGEFPEGVLTGTTEITKAYLPQCTSDVGANAFKGCTSLTQVTLPVRLKAIGSQAFDNTKIETITIPAICNTWADAMFGNCSLLTKIRVLNTKTTEWNDTPLNSKAFNGIDTQNIDLELHDNMYAFTKGNQWMDHTWRSITLIDGTTGGNGSLGDVTDGGTMY